MPRPAPVQCRTPCCPRGSRASHQHPASHQHTVAWKRLCHDSTTPCAGSMLNPMLSQVGLKPHCRDSMAMTRQSESQTLMCDGPLTVFWLLMAPECTQERAVQHTDGPMHYPCCCPRLDMRAEGRHGGASGGGDAGDGSNDTQPSRMSTHSTSSGRRWRMWWCGRWRWCRRLPCGYAKSWKH